MSEDRSQDAIQVEWREGQDRFPHLRWRLDDAAFTAFRRFGEERSFSDGELVFDAGAPSFSIFLVIDGEVAIERDGEAVGRVPPNHSFGELGLLRGLLGRRRRHLVVGEVLGRRSPPARAQEVEAGSADDGGQPARWVVDLGRRGCGHPQPRLLQRVVGVRRRAEHPHRDRPQARPLGLEGCGQVGVAHPVIPSSVTV